MIAGGPAFSAYANAAQSLTGGTDIKLQINTKEFDTATAYDNTTNYRFQPTVAGYYQISGSVTNAGVAANYFYVSIWKNGAAFKFGSLYPTTSLAYAEASVSALVYFNGSTDYVELYACSTLTVNTVAGAARTYFQGVLVRAA